MKGLSEIKIEFVLFMAADESVLLRQARGLLDNLFKDARDTN
jgi:hypothetical protein